MKTGLKKPPIKSFLESLQYGYCFRTEEPKEDGISRNMKSVKPYAIKLSYDKCLKGERINIKAAQTQTFIIQPKT